MFQVLPGAPRACVALPTARGGPPTSARHTAPSRPCPPRFLFGPLLPAARGMGGMWPRRPHREGLERGQQLSA